MKNRIVTPGGTFADPQIKSGNVLAGTTVAMDELPADAMTVSLDFVQEVPTLLASADDPALLDADGRLLTAPPMAAVTTARQEDFAYGQEVRYYHQDDFFALLYLDSIKRVGRTAHQLTCTSAIGLLSKSTHYGGIYTGARFDAVLADIIGGIVPYTVDDRVAAIRVYGWLPVASRRDNLHQLLFAEGVSIKRDSAGHMLFTTLSYESPIYIPDDKIFLGGSVDYRTISNRVSVTEHAYFSRSDDEVTTLYEGEIVGESITTPAGAAVNGALVTFQEPIHDLSATGATILERGVNYAVLSPTGSCVLTGKVYSHSTRVIARIRPSLAQRSLVEEKDAEVSVQDATLISFVNSNSVADRLLAYYGYAQLVTADLVVQDARPGDAVQFRNPFDEEAVGFLQSLDITMSGMLRAKATIVTGYAYVPPGNAYTQRAAYTSDFTMSVSGIERCRIVLIGGGDGGHKGEDGQPGSAGLNAVYNGESGNEITAAGGNGGEGGNPGEGGDGGKILIVDLDVSQVSTITGHIGQGGAANNGPGGASYVTVGGVTYTSASGASSPTGYIDQFTGDTYAEHGSPGKYAGARGGDGSSKLEGPSWYGSALYAGSLTFYGGNPNTTNLILSQYQLYNTIRMQSAGGGAAYLSNGGDATAAHAGGKGADASNYYVRPIARGRGGNGGEGGGGGGGGGGGAVTFADTTYVPGPPIGTTGYGGPGGAGGLGSPGTAGGDGLVLIYY